MVISENLCAICVSHTVHIHRLKYPNLSLPQQPALASSLTMSKRLATKTKSAPKAKATKTKTKAEEDAEIVMKWVGQQACGFRNLMKYRMSEACKKAWVVGPMCAYGFRGANVGHVGPMCVHSHRRHPEQEAS